MPTLPDAAPAVLVEHVTGAPIPPGFEMWRVDGLVVVLPGVTPTAPIEFKERYLCRVVATGTGTCPMCSRTASFNADPERQPAAWRLAAAGAHLRDPARAGLPGHVHRGGPAVLRRPGSRGRRSGMNASTPTGYQRDLLLRRHLELTAAAATAAFGATLARPCERHEAVAGEPCWTVADHPALCDDRARRTGFWGRITPSRRRPT